MQAALRCAERRTTEVHAPGPSVQATRIPRPHKPNRTHSRVHRPQTSRDGSGHLICIMLSLCVVWAAAVRYPRIVSSSTRLAHTNTNALPVNTYVEGAPPTNHTTACCEPTPAAEPFAEMAKSGGDCAASSIAAAIEFVAEESSRDAAPCVHTIRPPGGCGQDVEAHRHVPRRVLPLLIAEQPMLVLVVVRLAARAPSAGNMFL